MSESDVQWLRAGFAAQRSAEPMADPVDPETIWAAAHGEADRETTEALIDRMVRDPDLAEEWRIAIAARDQAEVITPAASRWGASPFIAAAVAIAAAVVLWVIPRQPGPEVIEVDSGTPGTYRGDPDAPRAWTLEREGDRLRWESVEGARLYRVRVMTPDFRVILDTRTNAAEVQLPPDAVAGALRWEIDAVRADGSVARRGSGEIFGKER